MFYNKNFDNTGGEKMIKNNEFIVMFDKNNCQVIAKTKLQSMLQLNTWVFGNLENNEKCKLLEKNDIGVSTISCREYERLCIYDKLNLDTTVIIKKIWNTQKYHREFSSEEVYEMYNEDYINFNLRNAIIGGFVEAKFIPIKDLGVRPESVTCGWKSFNDNPYLMQWNDDKLELGRSIKEIGTWFPFVVDIYDSDINKMYVYEGNHRIIALKLLAANGEIDDNFKVLCLRPLFSHPHGKHRMSQKLSETPMKYRYVIENLYSGDVLENELLFEEVKNTIAKKNEVFVNQYTVETTAEYVSELFEALVDYPYLLTYLIHSHNDSILPSKIINDEKEFMKWIKVIK